MPEQATLKFFSPDGDPVCTLTVMVQGIWVCPPSGLQPVEIVPRAQALADGEAEVQLLEGVRYEYSVTETETPLRLALSQHYSDKQGIVIPSRIKGRTHCGVLNPGLATGQLPLVVVDDSGLVRGHASVEVRSRKLNYKADYQLMLGDITERCVDLLQDLRAPSLFNAEPDPGHDSATIGQRFAFVRALLQSKSFENALHRITTHPHQIWQHVQQDRSISRGFKPSGKLLRQLAQGSRRIPVPASHPLYPSLPTLPANVSVNHAILTEDTPENRFVKFAIRAFSNFLLAMRTRVDAIDDARLHGEIGGLCTRLEEALASDVMRNVSEPTFLPLGSPTLQQREGYREVLQAWLRFSMAAKLVWHGGEDVYGAGQRDVATLYEYWAFFCLLDVVAEVFVLNRPASEDLLKPTDDGFGLTLKSGSFKVLAGRSNRYGRELEVRFSYNRTFKGSQEPPRQGSWTKAMRPDYTVSLWPVGFTESQAEQQGLMVHVHFDAKYRVDSVAELMGEEAIGEMLDSEALNIEKIDESRGTYKRADLLKMHAYRDAIRRTQGAYVIYPGDVNQPLKEYHEVLPGLGAFALRPGSGTAALKLFLFEVERHLANRSSAREQLSFHAYRTYRKVPLKPDQLELHQKFPEQVTQGHERLPHPLETYVVVGWVKSAAHLEWSNSSGKYSLSMGSVPGSLRLSSEAVGASYIFLHGNISEIKPRLFRVKNAAEGPRVLSAAELQLIGYPSTPTQPMYLVYDIEAAHEFDSHIWHSAGLPLNPLGSALEHPFTTSLHDLLLSNESTI